MWLSSAQKLTNIIKQIIEFAKMVPGFMKFAQDDQIALLKRGKNIKTWPIIKLGRGINRLFATNVSHWFVTYESYMILCSGL